MKAGQVWSIEYGCYVSHTFLPEKERINNLNPSIKIDIAKCIIKISAMGFYYLYLKDKKIQKLDFYKYQLYKKYVKDVIEEDYA